MSWQAVRTSGGLLLRGNCTPVAARRVPPVPRIVLGVQEPSPLCIRADGGEWRSGEGSFLLS